MPGSREVGRHETLEMNLHLTGRGAPAGPKKNCVDVQLGLLSAACVMTEPGSAARVHACFKYCTSAFQVALSDLGSCIAMQAPGVLLRRRKLNRGHSDSDSILSSGVRPTTRRMVVVEHPEIPWDRRCVRGGEAGLPFASISPSPKFRDRSVSHTPCQALRSRRSFNPWDKPFVTD